jgi:IclR family KDG regulon transcriptional repressor
MAVIKSIRNTLNILDCFTSENPEIRVTEISKKLGLSKSTVSRLLSTLEQGNFVAKVSTNQKYRLGPKILELASIFLSNTELRNIAIPYLRNLRNKTGEMVSIFVMYGNQRVCLEKVDSPHEVRQTLSIGDRYPLHAGSSGKLLLAYLPKEKRKEIILKTGLPRFTSNTITNFKNLEKQLNKIREEGYAVSHQERASFVASVSAPIRNFKGEVIAALCVSGLEARFANEKEFIRLTRIVADRISKELGYQGTGKDVGEPSPGRFRFLR